jgi:hypothetical protein
MSAPVIEDERRLAANIARGLQQGAERKKPSQKTTTASVAET